MERFNVITIRVIKSFEFGNVKLILMKDVDTNCSIEEFKTQILKVINTEGAYRPLRNKSYDTFKMYSVPKSFKSQNRVINLENSDETTILKDGQTLLKAGIINECEISFFVSSEYEEFKKNPQVKW